MAPSSDVPSTNNENADARPRNDRASSTINIQAYVIGRDKTSITFQRTNEIAKVLYDLQIRIDELAPDMIRLAAKSHLRELRKQLMSNQPNLASVAYCLKWFQANTPQLLKRLCQALDQIAYPESVGVILEAFCEQAERSEMDSLSSANE